MIFPAVGGCRLRRTTSDISHVYAYIAAVGDYKGAGCCDLPFWSNDQLLMQQGLINGLHLSEDHIRAAGIDGRVTVEEFALAMAEYKDKLSSDDVVILYFSGHGETGTLAFSNGRLILQNMIDYVALLPAAGKIIILDCCYSGAAEAGSPKVMLPEEKEGIRYAVDKKKDIRR